jgi:hypothetical protein
MITFISAIFSKPGFEYPDECPRHGQVRQGIRVHEHVGPLGNSYVLTYLTLEYQFGLLPPGPGMPAVFSEARSTRFLPLALAT